MNGLKKVLAVSAAGLFAAGALSIVDTTAAFASPATPGNCTDQFLVDSNGTTYGVRAKCTSGTGHYRVYATCTDELRGSGGTYYGPYVGIGSTSTLVCPYQGGTQWVLSGAHFQFKA